MLQLCRGLMAFKLLLRVGPLVSSCKQHRQHRISNRRSSRSKTHSQLSEPIPITALASDSTLHPADGPVDPPSKAPDSARAQTSQQEADRDCEGAAESATSGDDGKPRGRPGNATSASAAQDAAADGLGDGSAGLLPNLPGLRALSFAELLDQFDEWIGTKRVYEAMNRAAEGAYAQSGTDSGSGSDSDYWDLERSL